MAGNGRFDANNPFYDEDVDDAEFLRHSKSGPSGYMFGDNDLSREQRDLEDRRTQLLERKRQIEQRTVESSSRSIGLLRDSEQIGVATAEELVRQREQLERTEQRLDEINNTLRFSQKHIQSIKSVFGSLKNYISGRGGEAVPKPSEGSSREPPSALPDHIEQLGPSEHPGLRIRGLGSQPDGYRSTTVGDANKVLDDNLEEMCGSLSRLRGLAEGLGGEIETQNEMLDRISGKTDKADLSIDRQNRDMKRLLKK